MEKRAFLVHVFVQNEILYCIVLYFFEQAYLLTGRLTKYLKNISVNSIRLFD